MNPRKSTSHAPDYTDLTPVENHRNLAETVYQHLLAAISGLQIKPGESLNEVRLAERLGVSVTPVREALLRLSGDGLVIREPQRQPRVALFTAREIEEIYDIRGALESLAAAEAAIRATEDDFQHLEALQKDGERLAMEGAPEPYAAYNDAVHQTIMSVAGNQLLLRMMQPIQVKIRMCMSFTSMLPGRRFHGVTEHAEVLAMLRTRNAPGAAEAMRKHCEEAKCSFLEHYDQMDSPGMTRRESGRGEQP